MAKDRTVFVCSDCGHEESRWLGKCPGCGSWNTLVEEVRTASEAKGARRERGGSEPVSLARIATSGEDRALTGLPEMDRVLGGGVVEGSLVLVGGDPGIGKSTLLLQVCQTLRTKTGTSLYVTGEESLKQVKMRADRLGVDRESIELLAEIDFGVISEAILRRKPSLAVIDSIQTMVDDRLSSAPGSVSQVRDVTAGLASIAKTTGTAIMIVGHVTKEGAIAGPRVLEHMVDTVLYFEGERHMNYRILRAVKNRFGSTNEIGLFEMRDEGLVCVDNASAYLLSSRRDPAPGSVIVSSVEGTRPLLVEAQALVCPTSYAVPRRVAAGFDYNRVSLLLAVLEKKAGVPLHSFDAYVSVVGGLRIDEPACDLGILAAVASSHRNLPVDPSTVVIGEVGLTGEIRPVSQIDKRLAEAVRIGFKRAVLPEADLERAKKLKLGADFALSGASNISQALDLLF
jgi:DNA repair protein RadA/Sms